MSRLPELELGHEVMGSDGHLYMMVEAARYIRREGTNLYIKTGFVVSPKRYGIGTHITPVSDIPKGARFFARKRELF